MGKETIPAKARRTAEIPPFYAAIDTFHLPGEIATACMAVRGGFGRLSVVQEWARRPLEPAV